MVRELVHAKAEEKTVVEREKLHQEFQDMLG